MAQEKKKLSVKERSPHKAVHGYERDFKSKFAKNLGEMANELLLTTAKQLNIK